jgi:CBS domain-containing protein
MKARDIMSANPVCITPESGVRDAAKIMQRENVGVVPVVAELSSKKLLGVLTDRDIAIRIVAEGRGPDIRVSEVMSKNIRTHGPDDSVNDVMQTMGSEQVRRIPIVDEGGSLVGIVAQADIALDAPNESKVENTIENISKPSTKHAS